MTDPATAMGTVGAVFAALYAAHQVGDHWVQTTHQAERKQWPDKRGRAACAAHVATYTLTAVVALTLLAAVTGWRLALPQVVAGLLISAVSHYVADRRIPLRRLAELVGRAKFFYFGVQRFGRDDKACLGTGAYALDQSWHIGWLFVSALVMA